MSVPDYQSFMRPLLAQLADGEVHSLSELRERLIELFALTPEEVKERISSGKQTVFNNRLGWAKTYMAKAGLLITPQKAQYQITELGQKALSECPEYIGNDYLKQYPEFLAFIRPAKSESGEGESLPTPSTATTTPEEQIESAIKTLDHSLADDLLDIVKATTPERFEGLVVELMLAMGYGGSRKEAGHATQYTADGGIDGIIKEDPLGLDTIYLQAKRYSEKSVGRPEVQAFAGALDMKHAKKGVFITTSQFSKEAWEFVGMIEKKIILIDGPKLTELMIEHNLGVTPKEVYEVKQIDSDYFSDDS